MRDREKKQTNTNVTHLFDTSFQEKLSTAEKMTKYARYASDAEDSATGFTIYYDQYCFVSDINQAIALLKTSLGLTIKKDFYVGPANDALLKKINCECARFLALDIMDVSPKDLQVEVSLSPAEEKEEGLFSIKFFNKKLGKHNEKEFVITLHLKKGEENSNNNIMEEDIIPAITRKITLDAVIQRIRNIFLISLDDQESTKNYIIMCHKKNAEGRREKDTTSSFGKKLASMVERITPNTTTTISRSFLANGVSPLALEKKMDNKRKRDHRPEEVVARANNKDTGVTHRRSSNRNSMYGHDKKKQKSQSDIEKSAGHVVSSLQR